MLPEMSLQTFCAIWDASGASAGLQTSAEGHRGSLPQSALLSSILCHAGMHMLLSFASLQESIDLLSDDEAAPALATAQATQAAPRRTTRHTTGKPPTESKGKIWLPIIDAAAQSAYQAITGPCHRQGTPGCPAPHSGAR